MTEYLIEQLVKKQMTAKDNFKKTGLFALVVLSGLLIPFTQFAFLIMIVLIVIAVMIDVWSEKFSDNMLRKKAEKVDESGENK